VRRFGIHLFLARALHLQAQIAAALGGTEAARAWLREAHTAASAAGARAELWPILVDLSQLEDDPAAVEELWMQAQAIVESIAARAPADLQASFRSLPAVRAPLAQ
jgi:hypothetical protein